MSDPNSYASKVYGCLLAGALGDAAGTSGVSPAAAADPAGSPGSTGMDVSDNTQLALYTVDALVELLEWANAGLAADEAAALWLAYLRWAASVGIALPSSAPRAAARWIDDQPEIQQRIETDPANRRALVSGEMGLRTRPLDVNARGHGALARSAPLGLVPHIPEATALNLALNGAALTHGHPAAQHCAAALALMVRRLMHDGDSLAAAVEAGHVWAASAGPGASEVAQRLAAAVELAARTRGAGPDTAPPEDIAAEGIGEGTGAEDVLALAVWIVLTTADKDPAGHLGAALALAADTHPGSAVGSVAGQLIGACYGTAAVPDGVLETLPAADVVRRMADSLIAVTVSPGPE